MQWGGRVFFDEPFLSSASPTTMLACVDGMSEECQKILEDVNAQSGIHLSLV